MIIVSYNSVPVSSYCTDRPYKNTNKTQLQICLVREGYFFFVDKGFGPPPPPIQVGGFYNTIIK